MGAATLHSDLRAACRARLLALPGLPALPEVAWEGRAYEPTVGTPFVRESFRPISSRLRALGFGGTIEHRCTLNLVLVYPANTGTTAIEAMAGRLFDHFTPGTRLAYGASDCIVMQVERAPLVQEPDWLALPLTVTVLSHTVN